MKLATRITLAVFIMSLLGIAAVYIIGAAGVSSDTDPLATVA